MSQSKETLLFQFKNNTIDYKKEIIAGITTFLSMAYIIAVNPAIVASTGMPIGALVTTTCLTAALASILMGLYTNTPIALAPGMGLNAFFAFSVVIGMNIPWQVALAAVFTEGLIFIVLSLSGARENIANSIPINLKYSISVGIGLFIAFIGFVNGGIIIKNDATLVGIGPFIDLKVLFTFLGLFFIVIFEKLNVRGSILWAICLVTAIAWIYAIFNPEGAVAAGIHLPNGVLKFESIRPIFNQLDFSYILSKHFWSFITIVLALLFNDLFDTLGTLIAVAANGNMLDKNGKIPNVGKIFLIDAIATTFGAILGASTVTAFIESCAGIAEGGKTGLTTIVTGIMFFIAIFLSPLFIAVPASATAAALIYVGFSMCKEIIKINFSNIRENVPSFLTLFLIPLTYNISSGISIGIIFYVLINTILNLLENKKHKISPVMITLCLVFIIKFIYGY
ncbi:NCS2 family permease [Borreliella lusitaniae]|uniref:NCS2 family permease n=1 Tax=Borreliella lusitaniae TaxID=100177 RepID=A0ABZ0CPK5_9SPIR|nr:NCS2 family permease [Borreliella lusitaniae]WKC84861.1 NCS2 family permease [Borreliella lusitaniae]WNY67245.1 NCS2 family permease [Borreliella lusitaniae]WNY69085.1 NCS2 family permease [Borreliella lusitaniae]